MDSKEIVRCGEVAHGGAAYAMRVNSYDAPPVDWEI